MYYMVLKLSLARGSVDLSALQFCTDSGVRGWILCIFLFCHHEVVKCGWMGDISPDGGYVLTFHPRFAPLKVHYVVFRLDLN